MTARMKITGRTWYRIHARFDVLLFDSWCDTEEKAEEQVKKLLIEALYLGAYDPFILKVEKLEAEG